MNENELNPSEEVIETEVEQIEEEPVEEIVEESTPAPKDAKQSWKELREKAERADKLQKERDEYYAVLKQIQEAAYQQQQAQQYKAEAQQEEDFDYNSIDDDDLPDGRTFKKVLQSEQRKRKELENYIKQQRQESYENAIKQELQHKFNDFDSVVTKENIKQLREMRPGLARSLHSNPDLKERAIETYYTIRDLGIYEPASYAQDRERVKKNMSKPRPSQALGGRDSNDPLSYANAFSEGLTEELKDKLYKAAMKKAGRV